MPNPDNNMPSEWKSARFWLAIGVTTISIVSVAILATIIIVRQNDSNSPQNVLNSVLPLLGTWVGTVLAYYFSKENFEAATKSVSEMAKQLTPQEKLKSTAAKEKMIPRDKMFTKSAPVDALKVADVLDELDKQRKGNRVPILGNNNSPKYIIHRSVFDKFLSDLVRAPKPGTNVADLTIQDMLNQDPQIERVAESFGVIRADGTLADAMDVMSRNPDCQDVFVTPSGSKDEEILGWITNVIIQDNAKV